MSSMGLTLCPLMGHIFCSSLQLSLHPHKTLPSVLFTFVWLLLEPPGTRLVYPDSREPVVIRKCKSDDISFLVSLVYNMLLIIICTVYAVKTRKIPENFNESKFIGFSMYTTCIIWLAFVPIYFGTLHSFRLTTTVALLLAGLSARTLTDEAIYNIRSLSSGRCKYFCPGESFQTIASGHLSPFHAEDKSGVTTTELCRNQSSLWSGQRAGQHSEGWTTLRGLDNTQRAGQHSEGWTTLRELDNTQRVGQHSESWTTLRELDNTQRAGQHSEGWTTLADWSLGSTL
nr:metabotropic glutamate receptor-like [Biomphalaria glabrata]